MPWDPKDLAAQGGHAIQPSHIQLVEPTNRPANPIPELNLTGRKTVNRSRSSVGQSVGRLSARRAAPLHSLVQSKRETSHFSHFPGGHSSSSSLPCLALRQFEALDWVIACGGRACEIGRQKSESAITGRNTKEPTVVHRDIASQPQHHITVPAARGLVDGAPSVPHVGGYLQAGTAMELKERKKGNETK